MEDLTQQLSTVEDFTKQLQEPVEETDFELAEEDRELTNTKAQMLFGGDLAAITTQSEKQSLTDQVARDYNKINREADAEAVSDFIAQGQMSSVFQAQAMMSALATPEVKETPLEVVTAQMGVAEAIEDGDVSPAYLEGRRIADKLFGAYGSAEAISAKQQVLLRLLAESKEARSTSGAVGSFAAEFVPFGPQIKGALASPVSAGVFENRTRKEVELIDNIIRNPNVSPDEMYTTFKEFEKEFSPALRYNMYDRMIGRMSASDQGGFIVDAIGSLFVVGSVAKAATKGAKLGTRAASIAGKTSKIEKAAAGASVGAKAAAKAFIVEGAKEIPMATATVNAAVSPVKFAKSLARRKKYADLLAAGIETGEALTDGKVTEAILSDAISTAGSVRIITEDVMPVVNSEAVVGAKETRGRALDLLHHIDTKTGHLGEMTESAKQQLKEQAEELFKESHKRAKVFGADFQAANVDELLQSDGTYLFRYTVGTGKDGNKAFETKEAAEEAALNMNIKTNSRILADRNGYWIQVDAVSSDSAEKIVTETFEKEAVASSKRGKKAVKKETQNFILGASNVFGTTSKSTGVRRANALMRYEVDSAIMPEVVRAGASIDNLNKTERAIFDTIVETGRSSEQWVSSEWLRAKDFPEKVINAYENYHVLNDVEYVLANKQLRRQLKEQGGKLIAFGYDSKNNEIIQGIEYEVPFEPASLDPAVYYFRIDGKEEPVRLTEAQLREYANKGYRMTKVPRGYEDISAGVIRNLYDPSLYKAKELPQQVINYVAGGRRFYSKENTFIKQLQIAKSSRTGKRYVVDVTTITAGESIDGARRYAGLLEEARKVLIDFKAGRLDAPAATSRLQRGIGTVMPDGGDILSFSAWAERHRIDLNPEATIEAVADNAILKSYTEIMNDKTSEDLDNVYAKFSKSVSNLYSEEKRISKNYRSGGDIPQLFEDFVPRRMDASEELRKIVNDITNAASIKDFDRYYRENFKRVFKDVIKSNIKTEKVLDISALVEKNESNKTLYDNAVMAIRQYKTIKHTPNRFDEVVLEGFDNLLRLFRIPEDTLKGIHDTKALDRLRGANSFTTFAFAPAQIIKQFGSAAMSKLLMNPREFGNSLRLWAAYGLSSEGTPKALQATARVLGITPDELPQLRKFFDNINAIKSKGKYSEGGILDAGVDFNRAFVKGSLLPYTTGENMDRTLSAMMALLDQGGGWKGNKFRTLDISELSSAELAEVLNKMNRYYSNMDAAGMAPIQSSKVFQTVFQFQTYKMRWWEYFTDSELTKAQRLGFFAASAGLYGTIGLGLNNLFSGSDNEALKAISLGLPDYILSRVLEDENYIPSVGEIGSAEALTLADTGLELGASLVDIPVMRFSKNSLASAMRIIKGGIEVFNNPEYTIGAWAEDMKILLTSSDNPFTGAARTARAAEAFLTGSLRNSNRELSAKTISTLDTVAYLLGVNNLNDRMMYRAFDASSKAKKDISDILKDIKPFYTEFITNPEDNDKRIAYLAAYKLFADGLTYSQKINLNKQLLQLHRGKYQDSRERMNRAIFNRTLKYNPRKLLDTNN